MELEHIDQSIINNIGEDRLKHYNKILKEQVLELDDEIRHVEMGFKQSYGMPPFMEGSPDTAMRDLANQILSIQQGIRSQEEDLQVFGDVKPLKAWLKFVQRSMNASRFDAMPF